MPKLDLKEIVVFIRKTMQFLSTNRLRLLSSAAILLVIGWVLYIEFYKSTAAVIDPRSSWVFKQENIAATLGDLGGVPVAIPRGFANLVEYDEDPYWLNSREKDLPPRTYQSKIRSFYFHLSYPEFGLAYSVNSRKERQINVGVSSASYYGGDSSLESFVNYFLKSKLQNSLGAYDYERLAKNEYGLVGYFPLENKIAPGLLSTKGEGGDKKSVYYHSDGSGRVDVYIECGTKGGDDARCQQRFLLLPDMHAHALVSYKKELLPHWEEIQLNVSETIRKFSAR